MFQTIPLSLYIHIPWCVRKCPYCDFNSHALEADLNENHYIDALIRDLEHDLPKIWGRRLVSIFIGGGTPSLFSSESISRLLSEIHARIPYGPDIEVTMEANPGTFEQHKFQEFAQAGINRLSIGVQSFQDDKLQQLGRIHSSQEAIKAIEIAKQSGFNSMNIDLMHGLPNQTLEDALYDLQTALRFDPEHLSWYQLTIEPNTIFYKKPPTLPNHDHLFKIEQEGKKRIAEYNMKQYEISAYSKKSSRCKHNINYWEFGDYLGIGAGAHSKITDFSEQKVIRLRKTKMPKDYLDPSKSFIAEEKQISNNDLIFEFMLNAMRLYEPIPFRLFTERTGLSCESIRPSLLILEEKDFLILTENDFCLTHHGRKFLNDVLEFFC